MTVAKDLVQDRAELEGLETLPDRELLREAARALGMAVYVVAHALMRREAEALVLTRTGAVAVLMRALADSMRSVTAAFGQAPAADRDRRQ